MNQETEIAQEKEELILEPQALNTEDIKTNSTMIEEEDIVRKMNQKTELAQEKEE